MIRTVFHQDITPNKTPNVKEVQNRVVSSDEKGKEGREMYVDDVLTK